VLTGEENHCALTRAGAVLQPYRCQVDEPFLVQHLEHLGPLGCGERPQGGLGSRSGRGGGGLWRLPARSAAS